MIVPRQMLMFAGIAIGVLVVAYIFYPRKREGFQTATPQNTPVFAAPPPELVGNPMACTTFKSLIDAVNSQLQRAEELNNPAQKELLLTTKKSLEEQYAQFKCA